MNLPGASIEDRRIDDTRGTAEVGSHSRSETRSTASPGRATRIAPVVDPTVIVASENVMCVVVEYGAGEFVRRADGYPGGPPCSFRRCAIEYSCDFPECSAIISHVELVCAVIVKRRRASVRRCVVDNVKHARARTREAGAPVVARIRVRAVNHCRWNNRSSHGSLGYRCRVRPKNVKNRATAEALYKRHFVSAYG